MLDAVLVLRGDQDLLDADWAAVLVAHGDLGLSVRAQVGDVAVVADLGEAAGELVRERDRHRHQLGRLVRGVSEHHPLVACAGDIGIVTLGLDLVVALLERLVHTLGDVADCLSIALMTAQESAENPSAASV